jgi:hypothetical protein
VDLTLVDSLRDSALETVRVMYESSHAPSCKPPSTITPYGRQHTMQGRVLGNLPEDSSTGDLARRLELVPITHRKLQRSGTQHAHPRRVTIIPLFLALSAQRAANSYCMFPRVLSSTARPSVGPGNHLGCKGSALAALSIIALALLPNSGCATDSILAPPLMLYTTWPQKATECDS